METQQVPGLSGESVDDLNITKEELSDKINLIDQINTSYFGSEPRNKDLFACISPSTAFPNPSYT